MTLGSVFGSCGDYFVSAVKRLAIESALTQRAQQA
jgi:hypothetical protein